MFVKVFKRIFCCGSEPIDHRFVDLVVLSVIGLSKFPYDRSFAFGEAESDRRTILFSASLN